MEALSIEGAWVYTPKVHADHRGAFLETYRGAEFTADLGYPLDVAQVNCSESSRGVIRGIHYADVPPGQAKYVTCTAGRVLDVVVDLRVGSPTFGRWETLILDDEERRALYLAEGLGHGFQVLSESATVLYLCSTPYTVGREHGISPLDPALGIGWRLDPRHAPVLSGKDEDAPTLDEARAAGMLPDYADCRAYTARLRENAQTQNPQGERTAGTSGPFILT